MPSSSLISQYHSIDNTLWALSLVRKNNTEHAFLVLEGIDETNNEFIQEIHLTYKKDTPNVNTHAMIVDKRIDYDYLRSYAQNCHAYTWSITIAQANALIALTAMEKERAKNNELIYNIKGNTSTSASIGKSLGSVGLMASKQSSVEKIEALCKNHGSILSREFLRDLLVQGHSCYSWADAMVKAIQLTPPKENMLIQCVIRNPMTIKGKQVGEEIEETKCLIM